jgi:hypothetical protein
MKAAEDPGNCGWFHSLSFFFLSLSLSLETKGISGHSGTRAETCEHVFARALSMEKGFVLLYIGEAVCRVIPKAVNGKDVSGV